MAVYTETGRVGGGGSPAHLTLPASWSAGMRRRPFRVHAPQLSPNTRSALRATARAAGILRWVLLVVATLIMGGVTIASLLGFKVMIVTSGSMLPAFGSGDAVVIRPGGVGDIRAGDIITFRAPGAHGMTTHRVISVRVINGVRWFQTKGDANPTTDPNLVPADAVYGSQRLTLPNLGRFLYLALTPEGKLVLLGVPISFLGLQELGFLIRARRRRLHSAPHDPQVVRTSVAPVRGTEKGPEAKARAPQHVVVIPSPRSEPAADLFVRLEEEMRVESAHLSAAEDALAELERKVAELNADNGHVHVSNDLPPANRGLALQVALSG